MPTRDTNWPAGTPNWVDCCFDDVKKAGAEIIGGVVQPVLRTMLARERELVRRGGAGDHPGAHEAAEFHRGQAHAPVDWIHELPPSLSQAWARPQISADNTTPASAAKPSIE